MNRQHKSFLNRLDKSIDQARQLHAEGKKAQEIGGILNEIGFNQYMAELELYIHVARRMAMQIGIGQNENSFHMATKVAGEQSRGEPGLLN